jgi:5-methylcytosine-specific restriction enzyme A
VSLKASIEIILEEYPKAIQGNYKGNSAADFMRNIFPEQIQNIIKNNDRYIIEGSAGRGVWTKIPWVAIFDRSVTESAQTGYYVVYLFREDCTGVFLSLNQGVTTVREQYGAEAKEALRVRAGDFTARLGKEAERVATGRIDLATSSHGSLGALYEEGNICSLFYERGAIPADEELARDLKIFLDLYFKLILSELSSFSEPQEEDELGLDAENLINLRIHKRMERNASLAKKAKRLHGSICQVCGFNFEVIYGEIGREYIEAHHLTPLSILKGSIIHLDPKNDFCVLCANCHRMIHRTNFVGDISGFKAHHVMLNNRLF